MASVFDFTESSLNLPSPIYPVTDRMNFNICTSSPKKVRALPKECAQNKKLRFMEVVRGLRKELFQECDLSIVNEDLPPTISKEVIKSLRARLRRSLDDSTGMDNNQEVKEIVSLFDLHAHFLLTLISSDGVSFTEKNTQ